MIIPSERYTLFNDKRKQVSHIVWHAATGHWPEWPEVIHHIDENPFNNEFSNLQLMLVSDHIILHHTGSVRPKETKIKLNETWTPERRAALSAARMGKNNPNWKGG